MLIKKHRALQILVIIIHLYIYTPQKSFYYTVIFLFTKGTSRTEVSTINAAVVGEEFKKELILKREARQRAIAAVSSEMDRLRRELDAEKVAHSETSKVLELLKAAQNLPSPSSETDDEIKTKICNRCSDNISEKEDNTKLKEETEAITRNVEAVRLTDLLKVLFIFTQLINSHSINLKVKIRILMF